MTGSVITTDKAKCRDCYRCVRVCPIKAIRITDGQAKVDPERCILCGTCVRECPQGAKHVRNDLAAVRDILASSDKVIASVAPSFPAAFPEYGGGLLTAALRAIGFDMVTETSVGAEMVAEATAKLLETDKRAWVTSACPVVVNLIERYYPDLCSNVTPIISPMVAHGQYLKQQYGVDSKVVFVGPCSAKKSEAENEAQGVVDAVLTFEEVREAFYEAGIDPSKLQPVTFDDVRPRNAQLFPLEGGLAKTAAIASGLLREDFVALSGSDHVREMIAHIEQGAKPGLFEALFCPGGCINGACIGDGKDVFARRNLLLKYAKRKSFEAEEEFDPGKTAVDLSRGIREIVVPTLDYSEEQIAAVLAQTGKHTPEDELNCGACGYSSCRENAAAVLSGMAESSMCLPWMRALAERKTDQIIDNSPNGIIMVDAELNIVSFNPAFAKMFECTDNLIGHPLSSLMNPADFEKVAAELQDRISGKTVAFPEYGIVASESIYRLDGDNALIGIFANITQTKADENRIAHMREETLANAEQVIEKQMRMAQEIASILGETTSETRVLLRKLTQLAQESNGRPVEK